MRKLLLLLGLGAFVAQARLPDAQAARVVDAIYRIEGGNKTRHPYGILSVKVHTAAEARAVCLRTVQNTHDRWIAAGRPGQFLDFLADRYCPRSADRQGNINWHRNIHRLIHD